MQVHGSQFVDIIRPLPAVSGPGWKIKKRIIAISENSEFILKALDGAVGVNEKEVAHLDERRAERFYVRDIVNSRAE